MNFQIFLSTENRTFVYKRDYFNLQPERPDSMLKKCGNLETVTSTPGARRNLLPGPFSPKRRTLMLVLYEEDTIRPEQEILFLAEMR